MNNEIVGYCTQNACYAGRPPVLDSTITQIFEAETAPYTPIIVPPPASPRLVPEDPADWDLNWLDNEHQETVFAVLADPTRRLLRSSDDLNLWRPGIEEIQEARQADNIVGLIRKGYIKSPEDLLDYFRDLDGYRVETQFCLGPLELSDEDRVLAQEIVDKLEQKYDPERIFDFVSNQSGVTNNWRGVFYLVRRSFPSIIEDYQEIVSGRLSRLNTGDQNAVRGFFQGIPSRLFLEKALAGPQKNKLLDLMAKNWGKMRVLLGHIFYGEDRDNYRQCLEPTLRSQGLAWETPISWAEGQHRVIKAPLTFIDLKTMERKEFSAEIRILGGHRLLVLVRNHGRTVTRLVNPADASVMKEFARDLMDDEDPYFVYYFPKVAFGPGQTYTVSMNYAIHEKNPSLPENVVKKNTFNENLPLALHKFEQAFAAEDQYLEEAKKTWGKLFTPEELKQMVDEPYLDIDDLLSLMMIMGRGSAAAEAPKVFGISQEEYAIGEAKVYEILAKNRGMTRIEFLAKVIKAFDGRAMLAAVTAYNVLLPMAQYYDTSLMVRYPVAFKVEEDAQDIAGTIYHFMGCFFGAYAVQRSLVERYHQDPAFKEKIDQEYEELSDRLDFDVFPPAVRGLSRLELLKVNQYALVRDGDRSAKEVLTLTGVFWEEVAEDHDISDEVFSDLKGISAGHAFYELVSGEELTRDGEWFSRNDNRRKRFASLLKAYAARDQLSRTEKLGILWHLLNL